MKKIVRLFGMVCMMGAFAFLGSSCTKNEDTTTNINATLAAVTDGGTFGEEGRAYIDFNDNNLMKWSVGDQLMIYNLDEPDYWQQSKRAIYNLTEGQGTTQGQFSGDDLGDPINGQYFHVFYPAAKVKNHPLAERNSQTFDVPASQTYAKDCMDPTSLVMACTTGEVVQGAFMMKHIFGFANIRIADAAKRTVSSIVIEDKFFNLNGNITADLLGVDPGALSDLIGECANADTDDAFNDYMAHLTNYLHGINYHAEPGNKTMTLNCPGGVKLSNTAYTNFVITLRPAALSKGFRLTINFTTGDPVVITKYDPTAGDWIGLTNPNAKAHKFCTKPGNLVNFNVVL